MLKTTDLIDILEEAIRSLSDRDIVELDLCQLGLAVFPKLHRVLASPVFIDGTWHDKEIREGWTNLYGQGYLITWLPVLRLLDHGEIEKISVKPTIEIPSYPAWLCKWGNTIRTELLSEVPHAAAKLAAEAGWQ